MKELVQGELRLRLGRDCAAHAKKVRDLAQAHLGGHLEQDIALRSIALEVHSVKGVASVLGLNRVARLVTGMCESMLAREAPLTPEMWAEIENWFSSLIACLEMSADGEIEETLLETMGMRRDHLLACLGEGRGEKPPKRKSDPEIGLSPSAGRRVLFVDDSPTVRIALAARLSDRGYPVRTAKNLTEAAEQMNAFDPEIVITDVHMPEVEGDDLCRHIKARMRRIVPVILYSGMPEAELAQRCQKAQADGYVCKMHGIEGLIRRMDELLSDEILF